MQQELADSSNHSILFLKNLYVNFAMKHFQQIEGLKFTLEENVVWQSLHPKYFRFGIILEKQLTHVAKVGFFNILYH